MRRAGTRQLRRQEALTPKLLYAVDARLTPSSPVTDVAAADRRSRPPRSRPADGHVLDASHVIFPNGAITLVLILAESHLSIHTWPEENLIAIDLFSCGAIDGEAVISGLVRSLRLEAVSVRTLRRGRGPGRVTGRLATPGGVDSPACARVARSADSCCAASSSSSRSG